MAYKFQEHAKIATMTAGEVAVLGGSMILSKKFVDFNTLFKNKIAADPKFADNWYIVHQGGIKFIGGVAAAAYIRNPWVRMIAIGIAIEGIITEVRVLTTDKTGAAFFDKIGQDNQSLIDQDLIEAAKKQISGSSVTDQYGSGVGQPVSEEYRSGVGYPFTAMDQEISNVGASIIMSGGSGCADRM